MSTVAILAAMKVGVWAVPCVLGFVRRNRFVFCVCALGIATSTLQACGEPTYAALVGCVLVPVLCLGLIQRVRRDPGKLMAQIAVRDRDWADKMHAANNEMMVWKSRALLAERRLERSSPD